MPGINIGGFLKNAVMIAVIIAKHRIELKISKLRYYKRTAKITRMNHMLNALHLKSSAALRVFGI